MRIARKLLSVATVAAVAFGISGSLRADAPPAAPAPAKTDAAATGGATTQPSKNAAADFSLQDIKGKTHKLSDYKGKWVVLEWINHGCPFVKAQYVNGTLPKLQEKYAKEGVVWLSIASSAKGKEGYYTAEEWTKVNTEKKGKATAILLDADGKVGKLYGAKTTPHMFVINPKGEIVYQGAIDDAKSTEAEAVGKAKNYVAAALDAGIAGKPIAEAKVPQFGCTVKYAD